MLNHVVSFLLWQAYWAMTESHCRCGILIHVGVAAKRDSCVYCPWLLNPAISIVYA